MIFKTIILLNTGGLRSKLDDYLSDENTIVSIFSKSHNLLQLMAEQEANAIIISEDLLPKKYADTVQEIKSLPSSPLVIVITEMENDKHSAELIANGCDAVLPESAPFETLSEAVSKIINKNRQLQNEIIVGKMNAAKPQLFDFVSNSESMEQFGSVVKKVTQSDASLLLTGETGVGKERLARAIHNDGNRGTEPFIAVNCAALHDNLLASELFGHEKGAFTGATAMRRGAFELAHKGTIFLDEIGDMPLQLQSKLLRVLQECEFSRLGGERSIHVDIRIMAATNRDLSKEIELGNFRRDLYYRLSVVTLQIPPLRKHKDDIPELTDNYIRHFSPRMGNTVKGIKKEALNIIMKYDWPGNIRELINVIERAVLLCEEEYITPADLPEDLLYTSDYSSSKTAIPVYMPDNWEEHTWKSIREDIITQAEKHYIISLLKKNNGRINLTAQDAGITTRALYEKMKTHSIYKEQFKN
jgi:DNA-binding NtrC family response regulator